MSSSNRYLKKIEQAAGDAPPVPDATQVYQSSPPPIPRKKERGYRFSSGGLIVQRDLTDTDWRDILPEIKAMHSSYQLNYGDWMVYGFDNGYAVSYEQMAEMTGLKPQTIEVYTSVCRNVPQLIRINPLKFSHYRFIAPLPDDEKPHWIQYAASNRLSSHALEDLIALAQLPRLLTEMRVFPDDDTDDDRPTLSDETDDDKVDEQVAGVTVKEVKKRFHKFTQFVEQDRLQDMPRHDLYMLLLYVQDKYNQRRKMGE